MARVMDIVRQQEEAADTTVVEIPTVAASRMAVAEIPMVADRVVAIMVGGGK